MCVVWWRALLIWVGYLSSARLTLPSELEPQLENLLRRMLEKDANKRIKVSEIRNHPWITRNGAEPIPEVKTTIQVTEDEIKLAVSQVNQTFVRPLCRGLQHH